MEIARSSYYYWKNTLVNPSKRSIELVKNIAIFLAYHKKYPSHGYRWLNHKIRLDTGHTMCDGYAHKCCKLLGIRSESKHYRYKKPGEPYNVYSNLILGGITITGPMQCIVSDMTAFRVKGIYYELTLYMDLWNNEILSYSLSAKRGDRMTYINGLNDLLELKSKYPDFKTILHSDQGSVYASKKFNELLPAHNIVRSMSRAGTPTDNAAMESINGWIKTELFTDFHITGEKSVADEIADYIKFFNEERPAYSLNYLTPKQFRELYHSKLELSDFYVLVVQIYIFSVQSLLTSANIFIPHSSHPSHKSPFSSLKSTSIISLCSSLNPYSSAISSAVLCVTVIYKYVFVTVVSSCHRLTPPLSVRRKPSPQDCSVHTYIC